MVEQISDRFSKMSSDSDLEKISLKTLIEEQTIYLQKRLPSLGKDIELLGKLITDVQSLGSLVDLVKKARNKYEIYNERDKEY